MTALPDVAGRYAATELLGRGGAASVYRAWDRDLGRWVALKVLPADAGDRSTAERRREARMLAAMNHPGLVTLFDAVTDDSATYLVMELLGGGTLRARLADPALDLAAVGLQIARGLAHIHAVGVVHRDVKPANILLASTPQGSPPVAKLSDFGIAHLIDASPPNATSMVGTARYLSPEQAAGRPIGPPSDVYSLGLTLLEAVTGRIAFPGEPAESLAARLVRDPDVPPTLDYRWRSLLTAMVARHPASRPTADEVAHRLAAVATPAAEQTATAPIGLPSPMLVGVATGPVATRRGSVLARNGAPTRPLPAARSRVRAHLAGVALSGAVLVGAGAIVPSIVAASSAAPAPTPAAARPSASALPSGVPSQGSTASPSPSSRASRTTTSTRSATTTAVTTTDVQHTAGSNRSGTHTTPPTAHGPVVRAPEAPGPAGPPGPARPAGKSTTRGKPSAPKGPSAPGGAAHARGPGHP